MKSFIDVTYIGQADNIPAWNTIYVLAKELEK